VPETMQIKKIIEREFSILYKIKDKNILELKDYLMSPNNIYFVFELCTVNLEKYLSDVIFYLLESISNDRKKSFLKKRQPKFS